MQNGKIDFLPQKFLSTFCKFVLMFLFFLTTNQASATHSMGLDMTYTCLGNDSFLVKLTFYRDCEGIDAPGVGGRPLPIITVYSDSCDTTFNFTLPLISMQELNSVCPLLTTTCTGGPYPGVEEYVYTDTIVMPELCEDWTFSYGLCCRNNAINAISPTNVDIYVEATLNNLDFPCNNSPVFTNTPVPFMCVNSPYCFNNGAVDADGDSLVYTLITPTTGPNPDDTVNYNAGFDPYNPITSSPPLSLDSISGNVCMTPTVLGEVSVMQMRIEEWRNGVLMGYIDRDIQLRVIDCQVPNTLPIVNGINGTGIFSASICAGDTFSFFTNAVDPDSGQTVTMSWNNGISDGSFSIDTAQIPTGVFSWFPDTTDISTVPHCFTVSVIDDNCPFLGSQVFSFCLTVFGYVSLSPASTNATCNGFCDGSATINVTNGVAPYTYQWDDTELQTSQTATGLCAGVYEVTVTDSVGCTPSQVITITEPPVLTTILSPTNPSCNSDCSGSILNLATGGTTPYTFSWTNSGGQTTANVTGLCAGSFSSTVTDFNGCSAVSSTSLIDPPSFSSSITSFNNVSCNANADGFATVSTSGGTSGYTFLWSANSGNQTDATATGLLAGNYFVTSTDANGCTHVSNITLTQPSSLSSSLVVTSNYNGFNISCDQGCDGIAQVIGSGGTAPYTYLWDDPSAQTTQNASGLCAGTYNTTLTDNNGCRVINSITLSDPSPVSSNTTVSNQVSCNGGNDGSGNVTPAGGVSPYNYLWAASAGSQTTSLVSSLTAGVHYVTITDDNGCTHLDSLTITQPTPLLNTTSVTSNFNGQDISCFGDCNGSISSLGSGGTTPYQYLWDDGFGQTSAIASGLCSGSYSVTITDALNCSAFSSLSITDPAILQTSITDSSNISCNAGIDGYAIVTPSGGTPGYAFQWDASASNQTDSSATGLGSGTYSVTVSDVNSCISVQLVFLSQPSPLTSSVSATSDFNGQDIACFGDCNGEATAFPTGGTTPYSYMWDDPGFQTTSTASGLCEGSYGATVTDALGCTISLGLTLNEPPQLNVSISAFSDVNCFGGSDGEATVTASFGTPSYFYLWDSNTGSQTTSSATGLVTGTYYVTVTDVNACSDTVSVFIDQPTSPLDVTLAVSDVTCFGTNDGSLLAAGTGGTPSYNYNWSHNGTLSSATASNLYVGNYSVTATDQNNCVDSAFVTVISPTRIIINGTETNATCGVSNGQVETFGSGGVPPYDYLWSSNAGSSTDSVVTGLSAGLFYVSVTDSFNCQVDTFFILNNEELTSSIIDTAHNICYGYSDGSSTAEATIGAPPYNYSWSSGSIDSIATGLFAGLYFVTVEDNNLCINIWPVVITQPSQIVIHTDSLRVTCFGLSDGEAYTFAAGGTPGYSYLWDSNTGSQPDSAATSLSSGVYAITATDNNGCFRDTLVTITEPGLLGMGSYVETHILCFADSTGTIEVHGQQGTGPYSYQWGISSLGQSDSTASGLAVGVHSVTITDIMGCTFDTSFALTQPTFPISLTTSMDSVSCYNGSDGVLTVFPNGGTAGYGYAWDINGVTISDSIATGLSIGRYNTTVTDANGCTDTISGLVYQPDTALYVTTSGVNVSCDEFTDGLIAAIGFAGTPPYTFAWSNGVNVSDSINSLSAGVYTVTVTDSRNCTSDTSHIITQPDTLSTTGIATAVSCFMGNNGTYTISTDGGTMPYTYIWSNVGSPTVDTTTTGLIAGVHQVTINDSNGCQLVHDFTITEPVDSVASNFTTSPPRCFGDSNAWGLSLPFGGTAGYTFLWANGTTTDSITNISSGSYLITVTDSLGCVYFDTIFITDPLPLTVSVGPVDTICPGASSLLTASPSGGNGGYTFYWMPGLTNDSTQLVSPANSTNYIVTAYDQNGCISPPDTVRITVRRFYNNNLFIYSGGNICVNDTTTLNSWYNGIHGPYSYNWSHGLGQDSGMHLIAPLDSTLYFLTVTDQCNNSISDSILVEVYPLPELTLPEEIAEGCQPVEVWFTDTQNTDTTLIYNWNIHGTVMNDAIDFAYVFPDTGVFNISVSLTDSNQCQIITPAFTTVEVWPVPLVQCSADPLETDMGHPTIDFEASGANWYDWEYGDGVSGNWATNSHMYTDTGTYQVTVLGTNIYQCVDSCHLEIYVGPFYNVIFPTGFTPEEGGGTGGSYNYSGADNNIFFPISFEKDEILNFHLMVFNRWGEMVFETFDIEVGWNGYYKGELSQQDVYVWKMRAEFPRNKIVERTGKVTLIR